MNKYILYKLNGEIRDYAIISVKSSLYYHGDGDVFDCEIVTTDEPQSATVFNDQVTALDMIDTLCNTPFAWDIELLEVCDE